MEVSALRLLLVEDDPDDVILFTRALRKVIPNTDLTVARDGDEAVELLSGKGGAVPQEGGLFLSHVILDLKLPKRSGLEVLEWIRRRRELRDLQVVVLSSSRQPEDLERAGRAGGIPYYVKPPNFHELVEIVRRILREWRMLP
jgi:CheY-like chemotaxis protein